MVVLRKDEIAGFQSRLEKDEKSILAKKVSLVEGGEHRQDSVANGLNSLRAAPDDVSSCMMPCGPLFSRDDRRGDLGG